jgi:glycyl-tRNA synthetase beta subunit
LTREEIKNEISEFFTQRLRTKLLEKGFKREIVDSVLAAGNPMENMADTVARCKSVEKLVSTAEGLTVVKAGVRIGNILKADSPEALNPEQLSEPLEKELWKAFSDNVKSKWEKNGSYSRPGSEPEYDQVLNMLKPVAPVVDKFFEDIMVNDPDKAKRDNRHALLKNIDRYYSTIAVFPKLQPLLP